MINKKVISSFIICTKDRPEDLIKCLGSVKNQTMPPDELVIVDASVTKRLDEKIKINLEGTKIKVIYKIAEPGLTRQRNIGVDIASGDIVFFLDDDVILGRDYHEKMLEAYEERKSLYLGGIQGTIINAHKFYLLNNLFRKIFFLSYTTQHGKGRFLPSGNYIFTPYPRTVIEVEGMSGCCSSYYRKVFLEFRSDESLPGYALGEDLDLSYRVSRKYKLYQISGAKLVHNQSPVDRIKIFDLEKQRVINSYFLFSKNIPKKPLNIACFAWSLLGLAIMVFMQSIMKRDSRYLKGHIAGLKKVLDKLYKQRCKH